MPISAASPTLQIARQRAAAQPVLPTAAPAGRRSWTAAATGLAVAIAWVAAGALVIGLAWAATTASPDPPTRAAEGTLPYAVAWSGASLLVLGGSVGSLFAAGRLRATLLSLATTLTLALVAFVVSGQALLAG
jgi:hypothetical protein